MVRYAKTRPVFDGYKAARYSKKYLAELADYRAAKATMNELLNGAKLPKMDALKASHKELTERKKALYTEYRKAQREMRQAVAAKTNCSAWPGRNIRPRSVSPRPQTTRHIAPSLLVTVARSGRV